MKTLLRRNIIAVLSCLFVFGLAVPVQAHYSGPNHYHTGSSITTPSISSPSEDSSWPVGGDVDFSCSTASDSDIRHYCNATGWHTTNPANDTITYTWSGPGDFAPTASINTSTIWTAPSLPGVKTLRVTASDSPHSPGGDDTTHPFDEIDVIAVAVDRVTESGINDWGPIYIPLGDSITLQAYPDPGWAPFPSSQPVWTLTTKPGGSSLSPTLGSGTDTKVITPDVAGQYVIKAECGDSNDTLTLYAFKTDITTSTSTAMNITTTPSMPSVTLHADVTPASILSNVTLKWYLDMTFDHDTLGDLEHRVPTSGTSDVTGNENWSPSWGGVLAGGDVHVYVTASVPRSSVQSTPGEYDDDQSGYQIKGTNPTQAQIFAIAVTAAQKAICYKESTHRQFSATPYTGIGEPLPCYLHDGGYGLMMKTPSSEAQVWNWTTSLNDGIAHLNTEYARSVQHVSNINDGPGGYKPNPDPTPDPALTMTAAQHWMNAYSLYRSGTYYYGYEVVSGTEYQWIVNSGTGPDYADVIAGWIATPPW